MAPRNITGPASALLGFAQSPDPVRTLNWGQPIGADTLTGTDNGPAEAMTNYGQAVPAQSVAPGSYPETITATVTY